MTVDTEIQDLEARIDARFETTPLPTKDVNTSSAVICAVAEDQFRLYLLRVMGQEGSRTEAGRLIGHVDQSKYGLRYALELASKRLSRTNAHGPIGLTPHFGLACHNLLVAAGEYATAVRLFSSHHSGQRVLAVNPDTGDVAAAPDISNSQYNSLEYLVGADNGLFSPLHYIAGFFMRLPARDPRQLLLAAILQKAEVMRDRVRYKIDMDAARTIFATFNVQQTPKPENWEFPWGSLSETGRFYSALQTLCAYHLLAVHFSALKLPGIGAGQICYTPDRMTLESMVCKLSNLPMPKVRAMVEKLTLGSGVKSSDPALQPLVPIGGDRFAIPSFNVLSSNWSRNSLTLHVRLDADSFDRQSHIFEDEMVGRMMDGLRSHFRSIPNVHLPTSSGTEEVDVLVIDEVNKCLLLCELRWILQPGDAREVINKRKEVLKKIAQIERKVTAVRAALPRTLSLLGLSAGEWSVEGAVVIEGYGGLRSTKPKNYPIVPLPIMLAALNTSRDLRHAHRLLATPLWLPRLEQDFTLKRRSESVLQVRFDIPYVDIGKRSYMNENLPSYLADGLAKTPLELEAIDWDDDGTPERLGSGRISP